MQATMNNRTEFILDYVFKNFGTVKNAERVWSVECLDNLKRDLSHPFPTDKELRSAGILI